MGNVRHPSHYGNGSIECIDYIKDFLNDDEYQGYLRGNISKYLHRFPYKNGTEDLKKAQVYLNWLIEHTEGKATADPRDVEETKELREFWIDAYGYAYDNSSDARSYLHFQSPIHVREVLD